MKTTKKIRIYGHDDYPVPHRKAVPPTAAKVRYPGFKQEILVLKKGTIRRAGALPLPCDIVFERDVPMKLRDGVTIYTDIFRPANDGKYPALVAWSPYGKEIGGQWLDDIPGRSGVPLEMVSELQKFEGPDPAFWVEKGYVVLNPDTRGAYMSEGDISYWGRQLAEDGFDFIEWASAQPWCSGKVALSGNSWLAVSQWFIAAEQPPHLAAIAPWEGFTDNYRDAGLRGGIPMAQFADIIIKTFVGNGLIEDQPRMLAERQLWNPYWEDKCARLERINVPAYVVAGYVSPVHTRGTFDGFRHISSKDKWLRVHDTNEWEDYYTPKYAAELLRFFDHYLKGFDNGWEQTPAVRVSVINPGGSNIVDRVESAWPIPRTCYQELYLTGDRQLRPAIPEQTDQVSYDVKGPTPAPGMAMFTHTFDVDTEITGYMKLKLWVEADGADDMELLIGVEKLSADGRPIEVPLMEGMVGPLRATGALRVSHRRMDETRSTPSEPFLLHTKEEKLSPGEIVPVEIGIWPIGLYFQAGEKLCLSVVAHHEMPPPPLGFGLFPVPVPVEGGTFEPGSEVETLHLTSIPDNLPDFVQAQSVTMPPILNRGRHIIHLGGQYDSHLLVPVIPQK